MSTSVTLAATTPTAQEPSGRLLLGVSVKVVAGDAESVKACDEPPGHSSVKELRLALTDSEKVIPMVALCATGLAPLAGLVLETVGGVLTEILTVSVSVRAPPLPVLPWSSIATCKLALPL